MSTPLTPENIQLAIELRQALENAAERVFNLLLQHPYFQTLLTDAGRISIFYDQITGFGTDGKIELQYGVAYQDQPDHFSFPTALLTMSDQEVEAWANDRT